MKKLQYVEKHYPDTSAGAIHYLRDDSTLSHLDSASAKPDPSVRGVWMVVSDKAPWRRAIVYLAGYRDPFGTIRDHNDFEVED